MPPSGEVDAAHRVHVRDDAVGGERLVRRQPGVHGLEAEQPPQAVVVEEAVHLRRQPPQPAEVQQTERRPQRADEIERRVEVAVDEVRHLELVQRGEPAHEAIEGGRLPRAARRADLLGHRLTPVAHVDDGAVAEAGPVHRVDRVQREQLGHVGPGGGERLGEQRRHREHGRPGVEPVAVALDSAGAATGHRVPLDDGHVVSAPGEVAGGAEPAEAGADDHDVH
jgi:hypothetical protein